MGSLHTFRRFVGDSLSNLVSGLGTSKDSYVYNRYNYTALDRAQLDAAYRSNWLARAIVDAPAEDATREWREWQTDQDNIEKLENAEKEFDLQRKLKRALILARLYGGAAIVMGVNQGRAEDELDIERVKADSLKFVEVFHQFELSPGQLIRDIESPWFNRPEYYQLGANVENVNKKTIATVQIHPSRVITISGHDLPDIRSTGAGIWGDSVLQVVDDAVKATGIVIQGIATMITDAKMDVVKIPGLSRHLSSDEFSGKLIERFMVANQAKSMINTLLLDEKETWERVQTNFGSLPQLIQEYLNVAAGAAGIPISRLIGQAKGKGLGGTEGGGEVDTRTYYDHISDMQRNELSPTLTPLDEVFIRSVLGHEDESIYYQWTPLWQLSDGEKADIANKKAVTAQADVTMALINTDVLRDIRINQLIEDGTYPGIEDAVDEHGAEPEEPPAPTPEDMQNHIGMMQKSAGTLQQLGKHAITTSPMLQKQLAPPVPKKKVGDEFLEDDKDEHGYGSWKRGEAPPKKQDDEHPGEGYSKDAKLVNGVIHTDDVYDAVRALHQNRKVELKQPKQISTLIDKLGEITKEMVDKGEDAPVFDLCNVSVKGTNLFCADTKGIPRIKMPQLSSKMTEDFVERLKNFGYGTKDTSEESRFLRATQNQLDGGKVARMVSRLRADPTGKNATKRLVVSRDNYILDGHHHWAGHIAIDAMDGTLGDHRTNITRVDIDIIKLLELANKFTGGKGAQGIGGRAHTSDSGAYFSDVEDAFIDDYNREHEPAGAAGGKGGQFASKGGSASADEKQDRLEKKYGDDEDTSSTPAQNLLARNHSDERDTFDKVTAQLTPSQLARADKAEAEMRDQIPTMDRFKDANGVYATDRQRLHEDILMRELFTPENIKAATPREGEAPTLTLTGGRPAAGKTSTLKGELGDTLRHAIVISADDLQPHLPGYVAAHAGIYNGEGQDMAEQAEKRARQMGLNVVFDATLKTAKTAHERVDIYKRAGYKVHGYFVHTTPTVSAVRSQQRFEDTGRYVPAKVSFNSRSNEATFDSMIPKLDRWAVYDNNGDFNPRRIAGSRR